MFSPTEINQATNFIWYSSLWVLAFGYCLVIPAALLVLHKLLESFGIDETTFWKQQQKRLLAAIGIFSALLLLAIRYDGYRQAKGALEDFRTFARENEWDFITLTDIKTNINPEYDASFVLNVIQQDPVTFKLARAENEMAIAVKPGSQFYDTILTGRRNTINAITAGATQWRNSHPNNSAVTSTGVFLPFKTISAFVNAGHSPCRVVYAIRNNSDHFSFSEDLKGNIVSATIALPAQKASSSSEAPPE